MNGWLRDIYDIAKMKGAMHQSETMIKEIYYGFDVNNLFVRLDLSADMKDPGSKDLSCSIIILQPHQFKIKASFKKEKRKFDLDISKLDDDRWSFVKTIDSVGVGRIVEMGIPFSDIGASVNDEVRFITVIEKDHQELERWPRGGSINIRVPAADYEEKQWSV